MTISTAIIGWTCELCANDAIFVAVILGTVDKTGVGITEEDGEEDGVLPNAMLVIAFTFKYAGTA